MLLSIITVNLNNRSGLLKTIQSVIAQTFNDFEFIIIDGGSNDGSVELIKQSEQSIQYWVSEADKGTYHAMNKGIVKSNGEYCLFLNSGDYLCHDDVLSLVFKNIPTTDIISGNTLRIRPNGKFRRVSSPEIVSLHKLCILSLPHQASFIKRSLFREIGYYNEDFKIVSDFDFFLKAIIIRNKTYQHIEIDISYFTLGGASGRKENFPLAKSESFICLKENFPLLVDDLMEFRYFYNSNIGQVYKWMKRNPKILLFAERISGFVLSFKKWVFGK